jgi:hypothetical protein
LACRGVVTPLDQWRAIGFEVALLKEIKPRVAA